ARPGDGGGGVHRVARLRAAARGGARGRRPRRLHPLLSATDQGGAPGTVARCAPLPLRRGRSARGRSGAARRRRRRGPPPGSDARESLGSLRPLYDLQSEGDRAPGGGAARRRGGRAAATGANLHLVGLRRGGVRRRADAAQPGLALRDHQVGRRAAGAGLWRKLRLAGRGPALFLDLRAGAAPRHGVPHLDRRAAAWGADHDPGRRRADARQHLHRRRRDRHSAGAGARAGGRDLQHRRRCADLDERSDHDPGRVDRAGRRAALSPGAPGRPAPHLRRHRQGAGAPRLRAAHRPRRRAARASRVAARATRGGI
ncbi:MAG: dTDP-glucose 4,6-dehydratase, partial [uncultured Thermomicrobiales bacterium]